MVGLSARQQPETHIQEDKRVLEEDQMDCSTLAAESPDLNPIENLRVELPF